MISFCTTLYSQAVGNWLASKILSTRQPTTTWQDTDEVQRTRVKSDYIIL